MMELKVGRLLELHERLTIEKGYFERGQRELTKAKSGHIHINAADLRNLLNTITEIERISGSHALTSTQQAAARTKQFLSQAPLEDPAFIGLTMQAADCGTMFRHLSDISSRIRDDCAAHIYFQIRPENMKLLDVDMDHFGPDVRKAFSAAIEDISEAAACLALERSTGCVFHLMRALEVAAAVVAQKIGATVVDEHGKGLPWGIIADNMKSRIDKMQKGSEEQIQWYRVQSYLVIVGRAWRNPTAHPKKTYTADEARKVFEATKAFMQELASLA